MNNEKFYQKTDELVKKVISEMKDGKRSTGIEFSDDIQNGKTTIKEMIGTSDGAEEFVQKVTYSAYQGREGEPLLYQPIYQTKIDSNFPETLIENEFGPVNVVFLEKLEGGEVKFGELGAGQKKTISFVTWAAGVEYSEDIIEYNKTWDINDIAVEFGEKYNKLLNWLHLSPIIGGTYTTTGGGIPAQLAAQNLGTAQEIAFNTDVETTLRDAISVLPKGTIVLANSADQFLLEDAIFGSLYADLKTPTAVQRQIKPSNIIYYDGDAFSVGEEDYTYPGVTAGEIYLITPDKKNFVEYIKHDLRVEAGDGDLSRLIVTQVVGRARRAQLVSLGTKYGAVKVHITT